MDNIIHFLKEHNELVAASNLLDVMAKYASSLEEFDSLGRWYHDVKNYDAAIRYAEKALAVSPTNEALYACRANLAKLHNHKNNPKQALFYLSINERFMPDSPEVLLEKVFSLFLLNHKSEAEALLRRLEAMPDLDEKIRNRVTFNLGTYDLYNGNFKEGLRKFILVGKELDITKKFQLPFEQWEGGALPTKKLLIASEAGIGDEVINFRFCRHLRQRGVDIVWLTAGRKDLAKIFTRMGVRSYSDLNELVANEGTDLVWCYAMALPVYLEVSEADLWDGAYLEVDSFYRATWANSIVQYGKKVGIRWNGNPFYDHDLHRGIPIADMYAAVAGPNTTVYALQRDDDSEDVLAFPDIVDLSRQLLTFDDTMAAMSYLDVVVTSCTSVAHVAAAMGLRTIVLVPISAYYTWASTHDETSIWYGDNVTVLRQVEPNCWKEPLKRLAELI